MPASHPGRNSNIDPMDSPLHNRHWHSTRIQLEGSRCRRALCPLLRILLHRLVLASNQVRCCRSRRILPWHRFCRFGLALSSRSNRQDSSCNQVLCSRCHMRAMRGKGIGAKQECRNSWIGAKRGGAELRSRLQASVKM
jgi:hypothetical protein